MVVMVNGGMLIVIYVLVKEFIRLGRCGRTKRKNCFFKENVTGDKNLFGGKIKTQVSSVIRRITKEDTR